jgi:hypothetical protein
MSTATLTFGTLGAWLRFATLVTLRTGVDDRLIDGPTLVDLSHSRRPGSRRQASRPRLV